MRILLSLFIFLAVGGAFGVEVRKITRAPYTSQQFDLGLGVGLLSANTNLMWVEGNGSYHVGGCGAGCMAYVDFSASAAARDSQTHYLVTPGFRWQKNWSESSWSPYARVFTGWVHSIELIEGVRERSTLGIAVGTYYYLHPKGDLRLEMRGALGQFPFIGLLITSQFKFDDAARSYKSYTPEGL